MTKRKAVLITGASRGIGVEIARKSLLSDLTGHQDPLIFITARSKEALKNLEKEAPEHFIAISADLTQASEREQLCSVIHNFLSEQNAELFGIVHNAGVLRAKPFLELTEQDWDLHYQTHLLAPALLTRALFPLFGADGGHIIHISSMGGFQGSKKFPGLSAYSALKGALSILSEALATEFLEKRIACNALCLGAVQTEMLEEAFPGLQVPTTPEEMGGWIADFLWNGHRLFNGKILPVSLQDPE